ncbi:ABC transporter substrate-binding protein [Actinomadura barringtoniae]|uniref:ABC transporter substrate-binding protein n=1 Tax=Actinomadura barringtoniae TaxID=1427535 RepID=A0A939PHA4_9ACTN|nr:ABC transporter substrate-binding protein [Actinomadura barringtoniae]MBO2452666.1 ABC transporter substrate-binding protein [Actinomadura barringtoniae]
MSGLGLRKSAVSVAVVAVLGAAMAACGGGGGKSSDGTFTAGHSEPDHLTPGNTTSSYSFDVLSGLYDNLVGLTVEGKTYNLAAQSVDSTDQKVWTIKLKPGQKFSNGEPVTAQSYADSWNNAALGANAYEANEYFSKIKGYDELNPEDEKAAPKTGKLSGLKVVDDTTLEVTLTDKFNQFPYLLTYPAFAPLPKAAFGPDGKVPASFDDKPIGNGPYMVDGKWERNKQIKLVPSPTYTGPRKPKNKGYTWKSYSSAQTAYTDLRAGRLDVLQTIPAASVPEAKRLLGDRFMPRKMGTIDYLGFPLWDKRFQNPDLRKAISMSIDRQAINKAVYNGDYTPADSLLPPIITGHRANACGELCTYNPAKAKELFTKAGGFKGKLELYFSNAQPTYQQWMQIVANSLKQNLGLTDDQIAFRQTPASDYFGMLSKHEEKGPYRQNWEADYPSPQNYLEGMWGVGNKMTWKNKDFDAAILKANTASDQATALQYYNKAEDIATQDMPMIPLWTWTGQGGRSKRVSNVTITAWATGLIANEVTVK